MKKNLLRSAVTLVAVFSFASPAFATNLNVDPTTFSNGSDSIHIDEYAYTRFMIYNPDGTVAYTHLNSGGGSNSYDFVVGDTINELGSFHVVAVANGGTDSCATASYTSCTNSFGHDFDFTVTYNPPPPPPPAGVNGLVSDANDAFGSATGFDIPNTVSWVGSSFIGLFIGSGLAVLYNLRWWLIAILIITNIVTWAYLYYRYRKTGSWFRT